MNALEMLRTSKTVAERADSFAKSIKRNIQRNILDPLVVKQEEIESEIFELSNFTLDTNHNRGLAAMTQKDCEDRFARLIQIRFDLDLTKLELKSKQAAFDEYFPEEVVKESFLEEVGDVKKA